MQEILDTNKATYDLTLPEPLAEPKYTEGQIIGREYSARGPIDVVWRNGIAVSEPVKKEFDINQANKAKLTPEHVKVISFISGLLTVRDQQKITIPIVRKELEEYVSKKQIKELERLGLIESELAQFMRDGKPTGAMSILWLTGFGEFVEEGIRRVVAKKQETINSLKEVVAEQSTDAQTP